MGDKNLVYPQRYIPFDLGRPLTNSDIDKIGEYCRNNLFKISPITDLLKDIAPDIVFKIIVSGNTNLYLFSYGIGVFVVNLPAQIKDFDGASKDKTTPVFG